MHAYAPLVDRIIELALEEDLGPGDVTTEATVAADARGSAELIAKAPVVLAGLEVFGRVFTRVDPALQIELCCADGDRVEAGGVVARVQGSLRAILVAERTALNFAMRLSGIATSARRMREALSAYPAVALLDTRKTSPGLRVLEKAAVRAGGGANHRCGLYDGILIKDNHIAAAGSVTAAVQRARDATQQLLKVECEVSDLSQLDQALAAGADVLLLDNMDEALLAQAVARARQQRPQVRLEASGNMSLERLPRVAACGVDAISVGALTHSAPAADLSLRVTAGASG